MFVWNKSRRPLGGLARPLLATLCLHTMLFFSLTSPLWAEDTALTIGITNYRHLPLPGIRVDLKRMQTFAQTLNFTHIEELYDKEATRRNILDTLQRVLIDNVGPEDRILLYLSVHGVQIRDTNGDERDGLDEAILPIDFEDVEIRPGVQALGNVITDDLLYEILTRSPARMKFVIIDSCFSGSMIKSFAASRVPRTGNVIMHDEIDDPTIVLLSAGHAEQEVPAFPTGSPFTESLEKIAWDAADKGFLTPEGLTKESRSYLNEKWSQALNPVPQPRLLLSHKDRRLGGENLFIKSRFISKIQVILENSKKKETVSTQYKFRSGDIFRFAIEMNRDSYITLITETELLATFKRLRRNQSDSAPVLLFPIRNAGETKLLSSSKTHLIPEEDNGHYKMDKQTGKEKVYIILSKRPLNLLEIFSPEDGKIRRDPTGAGPDPGALSRWQNFLQEVRENTIETYRTKGIVHESPNTLGISVDADRPVMVEVIMDHQR